MKIACAAGIFPENAYDQETILETLEGIWRGRIRKPELLERFHARSRVERRHLALPLEAYGGLQGWGQANSLWIEQAQELGEAALRRALSAIEASPGEIGALYFVSVTGIANPSIDARLVNRMGLSPHVKRLPIFGLGCVAGAAAVARAADYVRAFPDQIAAVLSVELCSLTWRRDDLSPANMVATALFGDGAAAVVVAGSGTRFRGPEVLATRSVFYPDSEEVMGWDISEQGFRIVLSPRVSQVIERHLRTDVDAFLADQGLRRGDISGWIIHTGGPKVLEAVARALELPDEALQASWDSLRRVGNLSSASVLVVLEEVLLHRRGAPGTYSLLAAMGPGFCSELVLLRW